jgi:dipeptide/tripeptide permease
VLPVAVVVILTVGELYLSPIGLAFVSGCVPPHARSTAIGFWFLSSGLAGPVAGQLGVLYSLVSKPAFFGLLAALSLANGAVLYAARHRLQRGAATHERQPLTEQQSGANSPQEGVEIEAGAGGGDRKQED